MDIPRKTISAIVRQLIKKTSTYEKRISKSALKIIHEEAESFLKDLFAKAQTMGENINPQRKTLHIEMLRLASGKYGG
jgi:histone H3/H4